MVARCVVIALLLLALEALRRMGKKKITLEEE
jgi:hypothetical protein